jgi:hypothetical protein
VAAVVLYRYKRGRRNAAHGTEATHRSAISEHRPTGVMRTYRCFIHRYGHPASELYVANADLRATKKMDESGTEVMYHDSYAYRHEAIADVILSLLMNTSEA